MDFNYDLGKNFGKEIKVRKQEEKPVSEAAEETKADEPSSNLRIPTSRKITADSTAINAAINQALIKGQNNKPAVTEKEPSLRQTANDGGNNIFVADDITVIAADETAGNIFGEVNSGNAIEKDPAVIASGGVGALNDRYEDLVEEWYSLDFDTATYEEKMNLLDRIIIAAQNEENDVAAGTWTCYRFIMRNNYLKEKYNSYLQQLASGVPYEQLEWQGEIGWSEEPWEISAHYGPDGTEDYEIFQGQCQFGGTYVQLIPNMPAYEYIPAEPEQAYVYACAMIARYSTKILAIQVKLQDPDIIYYPNPNGNPENVLVWKLNQDIEYYRVRLQHFESQKRELAVQLGYATQEENGAIHFNVPDGGLVPGLYPPENNPTPLSVQEQFEALRNEYFEEYGNPPQGPGDARQIEKVNTLITFASRMVGQGQSAGQGQYLEYFTGELAYWRAELLRLQNGH